MAKFADFEDFVYQKFCDGYIGLDDDLPDEFDRWMESPEIDLIMEYAEEYAKVRVTEFKVDQGMAEQIRDKSFDEEDA